MVDNMFPNGPIFLWLSAAAQDQISLVNGCVLPKDILRPSSPSPEYIHF